MDAIDGVNAIADAAPGFVWRLEDEDDDEHPGRDRDPRVRRPVADREPQRLGVTRGAVGLRLRRRPSRHHAPPPRMVHAHWPSRTSCSGGCRPATIPTVEESVARLDHLREHGPTPRAFTFKQAFAPDDERHVSRVASVVRRA